MAKTNKLVKLREKLSIKPSPAPDQQPAKLETGTPAPPAKSKPSSDSAENKNNPDQVPDDELREKMTKKTEAHGAKKRRQFDLLDPGSW